LKGRPGKRGRGGGLTKKKNRLVKKKRLRATLTTNFADQIAEKKETFVGVLRKKNSRGNKDRLKGESTIQAAGSHSPLAEGSNSGDRSGEFKRKKTPARTTTYTRNIKEKRPRLENRPGHSTKKSLKHPARRTPEGRRPREKRGGGGIKSRKGLLARLGLGRLKLL